MMGFLTYIALLALRIIVVIVAGNLIVFTMGSFGITPDMPSILLAAIVVILCARPINGN